MGTVLSVQTSGVVKWCQDNWNTSSYLTPNHLTNFPSELELKASLPVTMRKDEVLVIARDHPQKNLDFLLASWVYVEKSNPNAYLTIVGPEFPSRIENLANNLGLRNLSVQIRTEHLSEFFNKSKLFVSTSLFEGFPNVVLEAFSYGVPVITTPSCDVVEDFAKAGAAIVVYSQNPTEFADVLVQALEGKDELLEISHNALAISKNYSWEQVRTSWYAAIAAAINMH